MTKEQLFESMGGIDDEILERSEKTAASGKKVWKVFLPLAACFCIVVGAAVIIGQDYFKVPPWVTETTQSPGMTETPQFATEATAPAQETKPPISPDSWTAIYNENFDIMYGMVTLPGFVKDMSQQQLKLLLPDTPLKWRLLGKTVRYYDDGTPCNASLILGTDVGKAVVFWGQYFTDILSQYPVKSKCGEVEYRLYSTVFNGFPSLYAKATINGTPIHIDMYGEKNSLNQAKQIFKEILTCFANYSDGKPYFQALTMRNGPGAICDSLHSDKDGWIRTCWERNQP